LKENACDLEGNSDHSFDFRSDIMSLNGGRQFVETGVHVMKTKLLKLVLLSLLLQRASVSQAAPQMEAGAPGKPELVIIEGATIIDGTGKAPHEASLMVRGDTIIKTVEGGHVRVPAGARVIDVQGKFIMPTLICAHAHLGLIKGPTSASSNFTPENVERHLQHYAQYGVGTVMSLGADHDSIYDIRDKRRHQLIHGAYVLTAGRGFGVDKCMPPVAMGIDQAYRPATSDEASKDIAELANHHPDIVKLWLDDNNGKCVKMSPEIYKTIIQEAHRHGMRVAAHIFYLEDAKALVGLGVNVLAHSIRDLPVDQELIQSMKRKGVFLIPTLDLDEAAFVFADKPSWMSSEFFTKAVEPGALPQLEAPKYVPKAFERDALALAKRNLKTLFDAGVPIGFGTDSGAKLERVQGFAEHRELQLMVEAGLTPLQAIQCATKNSAELLGISKTTGTLEPGKRANFIVLDADPLTNIANTENISAVYIDGQQVPRD
jgi:imidazolonepropionase-like amidohydrolase